jgi:acyl carrier protein
MSDVATDVMSVIQKKIRVDRSEITPDDKLTELGLESLDALELVFDLEEKFDIEIPVNANDPQIGGFEKVSDVIAAVQKIIDNKKAQSA